MLAVVTVIADVNFEKVYVAMETYARTQMYEESSCVCMFEWKNTHRWRAFVYDGEFNDR